MQLNYALTIFKILEHMNSIKMILFLFTCLLSWYSGQCQDSFYVTVHFPSRLTLKSITLSYEDGKNDLVYKSVTGYTATLSGPLYARYADITLYYPDSAKITGKTHFTSKFWVGKQHADIIVPESHEANPFTKSLLTNAWSIQSMGNDRLDSFQRKEWQSLVDFLNVPRTTSDSNTRATFAMFARLRDRQLKFIRQNPSSYFSLWVFRKQISNSLQVNVDTIQQVFNTVFPDSLQNTPDGKVISSVIEARLNTSKGRKAPDYTATATDGRIISPKLNKGKYVLVSFWASWCGPCVAEMPAIIALRSKYDTAKLKIVSVTLDEERKPFENAVANYHMSWPQIFGNQDIVHAFNISVIPQMYLIDPEGKIIYKGQDIDIHGNTSGDTGDLHQLNDILAEKLHTKK
jgi:thiol-disulfide isomerase/thioredoxin